MADPQVGAFVGRDDVLTQLLEAFREASAGRTRAVLLTGDPGIGKTRVMEEFASLPALEEACVLWGGAWAGGAPAFWPWIQIVRSHLGRRGEAATLERFGSGARCVADLIPALRTSQPAGDGDPGHGRFELFDAFATFLANTAHAEGAAVVVLDDLHLADESSLRLAEFVIGAVRTAPLLLLGSCHESGAQPGGTADALGRFATSATRVALGGLTEAELSQLVAARTGTPPDARVVARLHALTDGNPSFADALLATATGPDTPLRLPDQLLSVVRSRLAGLSDAAQAVLGWAAVLGTEFGLEPLPYLAHLPARDLVALLAEARAAGVVRDADQADRYRFCPALVRDIVYDGLGPDRRVAMHGRVGDVLEGLERGDRAERLPALAHHYRLAAPRRGTEKALRYTLEAARTAARLLAHEEAAGGYQQALDLLAASQPAERARLLLLLADEQWRAGRTDLALDTLEETARLARQLGDGEMLARAALRMGGGRIESGAVRPGLVKLLEEALAGVDGEATALRVRLLGRLAVALYFTDDYLRRDRLSAEAVTLARKLDDPAAVASSLNTRHFAIWGRGTLAERLALAEEATRLAQDAGDAELVLEARTWRVVDLLEYGDRAGLDAEVARYVEDAEALRLPVYRWYGLLFATMRALLDGRLDAAEELVPRAVAAGRAAGIASSEQFGAVQLYLLRREQGRLPELAEAVEQFAAAYPALPVWRCGFALLLCETGRAADAIEILDELAADGFGRLPPDGNWLASAALLAEVCVRVGATGHAQRLYELLLPHADQHVVVATAVAYLGAVSHYLGLLAAALGEPDAAAAHFADARHRHVQMRAPAWLARTEEASAAAAVVRLPEDSARR
ncbi:MAG: AAA family ATPase [Actinobacteria bacterium]|nr:AAA family ATPase [Actinomycetota bacterium]